VFCVCEGTVNPPHGLEDFVNIGYIPIKTKLLC
jgi:hypothetical protein